MLCVVDYLTMIDENVISDAKQKIPQINKECFKGLIKPPHLQGF
jgi:hypothetical protein